MLEHLTNHNSNKSQFVGEVFSLRKRVPVEDFPGKLSI